MKVGQREHIIKVLATHHLVAVGFATLALFMFDSLRWSALMFICWFLAASLGVTLWIGRPSPLGPPFKLPVLVYWLLVLTAILSPSWELSSSGAG